VHLKWRLFSYIESKLRNAPLPIFCVELHRSLSTKSLLYCFDLLSLVYYEQRWKYSLRICRHVSLFIFIYLAGTRCLRSRLPGSHMFCFCILLFLSFLRIVCQPFNLDFHWTDFHAVSPFGSAMAVDDQSKPRFLIFQGTLPWQPTFVFRNFLLSL